MATKTLAEIYLKQGHFQEAYEIFRILHKRNPSDMEIQKRLKELDEKLNPSSLFGQPPTRSTDEKVRLLERWLGDIRKRRKE